MPSTPPPYTLLPCGAAGEADIEAFMANATPAFFTDALRAATFPPHLVDPRDPDEELDFRQRRIAKRLADGIAHKIVVDDPDGPGAGQRIAAWAVWMPPTSKAAGGSMSRDGEGEKKVAVGAMPGENADQWPKCAVREIIDEQVRVIKEGKEKAFGEGDGNFWYLAALSCHPNYQGKGMGAALVRWGMEQAEKDGVPVYLEATPAGKFLYTKLGFEVVAEYDFSRFLPDGGKYALTCMLWKPGNKVQ